MNRVYHILTVLTCFIFIIVLPVSGREDKKQEEWMGTLENGKIIRKNDLEKMLIEHGKLIKTFGKEGKKADLRNAKLRGVDFGSANLFGAILVGADLCGAYLHKANLCEAKLIKADLGEAYLHNANLCEAKLIKVDLSGAYLRGANLRKADLSKANIRGANMTEADLQEADLRGANMMNAQLWGVIFEPQNTDELTFLGAKGLSNIHFEDITAIVNLRKKAKESFLRNEERAFTSALRKYCMRAAPLYEKLFVEYVLLGILNDFGAKPWNNLVMLLLLIPFFSVFYIKALSADRQNTGIWALRVKDRVLRRTGKDNPIKLRYKIPCRPLPRGKKEKLYWRLRVFRIGLYFSILSAFSIGWRELNFGNWITRLQCHEYVLRATGWVRTVSGIQSLISVYLLALWALTYFGRPFE